MGTHAGDAALWRTAEDDLQFVLSRPNGWEGTQQTKMGRDVVYGGIISDTVQTPERQELALSQEANLQTCVLNGLTQEMLAVYTFPYSPRPTLTVIPVIQGHPEHGFLVADAGGSGGTLMCVSPDVISQSHKRSADRCITHYT